MPVVLLIAEPALFLLGAALLGAALRGWRPEVSWRTVGVYVAGVSAFFAAPLFTGALQVPTDIAYRWLPWREAVTEQVRVRNPLLGDCLLQQLPFRTLVRERLFALEAPLWANELATGEPLLGNALSSPFAPLHLMALPLPPLRALTVAAAWQTLLGLLLMHALMLRLGAGPAGAAFAAVSWQLSTFAVAWQYGPIGMTAAWIPGLWLGLLLLRNGERGAFTGLTACGVGLALSGHPETMAHTGLSAAGVTVALLLSGAPGRGRFAVRLAGAAALVACLSAPALLPFLAALPESERMMALQRQPDAVQPDPFEAQFVLPVIDPLAFGTPRNGDWTGTSNFNELCSDYAGLVALAAALAGAAAFRGRILAIVLGGGAALLASLGISPFHDLIFALPVVGHGANARLRLFWVLTVAVAGGLSVDRLAKERRGRWAAAVALLSVAAALAFFPPPFLDPWEVAWWIAALLSASAVLAALLIPRLHPHLAKVALAALLLELSILEIRYQPAVPARYDLAPLPALDFVIERSRTAPEPARVTGMGFDFYPNLAALYGLSDPRPNDPMAPGRAARFVRARLDTKNAAQLQAAQDFLGVRYAIVRRRKRMPAPWKLVFSGPGGRVWENPGALPFFFMPRRIERLPADGPEYVLMIGRKALRDFRSLATEIDPRPSSDQAGDVRAIRAAANGFDLEVATPTGGTVASSVAWVAGWRLEVDGRAAPVQWVNRGFLGFEVPPGTHHVRLRYRPAGWAWGLVLAAVGCAASLGAALVTRRRRVTRLPDR